MTKQEIRKLWTDALRSGDYKQGESFLRKRRTDEDVFCCLGVLCELAVKEGITPQAERMVVANFYQYADKGQSAIGRLPDAVKDWAGLAGNGGEFTNEFHGQLSLAGLNDLESLSFSEIADFIDSNPEGLFRDDSQTT